MVWASVKCKLLLSLKIVGLLMGLSIEAPWDIFWPYQIGWEMWEYFGWEYWRFSSSLSLRIGSSWSSTIHNGWTIVVVRSSGRRDGDYDGGGAQEKKKGSEGWTLWVKGWRRSSRVLRRPRRTSENRARER